MQSIENLHSDLDSLQIAKSFSCDIDDVKNYILKSNFTLNLLAQNIRSVNCNLSNLTTLLQRSEISWDILVLSECWLHSARSIPVLDNYNYASTTSHRTQNEGVIIYYVKNLPVTVEEPEICDANCLLLKINSETCIIGIYRPPNQPNTNNFMRSLDSLLAKLSSFKNIVLCGDINIDIAPNSPDKRSLEYLNVLASHCLLPGHTALTHGRTCLDHVMIKTKFDANCFVFESSITDHETVAISMDLYARPDFGNKTAYSIDFKALDDIIQNTSFQPILESTDANTATDLFMSYLSTAINNNSRLIKIPKRQRVSKPWITKGLLRCMRNRDNLHKKLKRDPANDILKVTYKRYRNFCNSIIKKAKRNYDKKEIENAKGNKKQLWDAIKKISGSTKPNDFSSCLISSVNKDKDINSINNFFANVGKNLAEHATNLTQNMPMSFDAEPPLNSFVMLPPDEDEVFFLIKELKDKCAVGYDQISGKFLKRYIKFLTTPITHICKLAMATGVFPIAFKLALIKPIHKGGDRDCVDNYRPISILPTLSKILERLINRRLTNYLETNNLLSPNQYGFRRKKSTDDAVHELVDSIIKNLDQGKKCVAVFLDLAKAFDTVSVPHLLKELERFGVRGIPLKLMKDYLSGRKQRVRIDNRLSDEACIEFGVPQGSILGPTLFLVYINGLCQLQLLKGKILTYADDTVLFFSGQCWEEVYVTAQKGFNRVCEWLRWNILTLNVNKTKYVAFAHRSNHLPHPHLKIYFHACVPNVTSLCSCPVLERVDEIKYLGIIIDQFLTFKPHIKVLVTRLRKLIYIFKTLRHVADRQIIKMVYDALCQSLTQYCITSWGGAAKSHLIEVERAQRAILKVGAGLPFLYPTVDLFKDWDVLTIRQIFILHTLLKEHSLLPYDPNMYRDKRRKGRVCQTQPCSSAHSRSFFFFLGPYLYNNLNKILNIYPQSKHKCKISVTTYLKTLDYQETEKLLIPLR